MTLLRLFSRWNKRNLCLSLSAVKKLSSVWYQTNTMAKTWYLTQNVQTQFQKSANSCEYNAARILKYPITKNVNNLSSQVWKYLLKTLQNIVSIYLNVKLAIKIVWLKKKTVFCGRIFRWNKYAIHAYTHGPVTGPFPV